MITGSHDEGELAGEPVITPAPRVHVGKMRTEPVYGMPMRARARAAIMDGVPSREVGEQTREQARKFLATAPGIGHGDSPGDVPGGGTPTANARIPGGSVLPLVAASRQIARTSEEWTDLIDHGQVIPPPYDPWMLVATYEESDALPPLVEAMATNLTGFGFEIKPLYPQRDDDGKPVDPPPEAAPELEALQLFLATCNVDQGLIGMLQCVDQDVEVTGNGYVEVLRDKTGRVASLAHARSWTMRLGKLSRPILVDQPFRHPATGALVHLPRYRRFRTFVQVHEGRVAYFKQFGDPRFINWTNGQYQGEPWPDDANGNNMNGTEIVHRLIYATHSAYGVPRWVGAIPHVKAGRHAGELIVSWFDGAPIGAKLAMVSGGTWSQSSYEAAVAKIDDMARGAENAWSLVVLEAEAGDLSGDLMADSKPQPPRMNLEDLAYELPAELYSGDDNLLDGSQRRTARMFRLPPVYWGGSDDYSRAAVNSSRATTEEQVFVPERETRWLQWFNVELLPSMGINLHKLGLHGANTNDDSENADAIDGFVRGGGVSPNMLIRQWNEMTGAETDPITEPWGDRPLDLTKLLIEEGMDPNVPLADAFAERMEPDPQPDPSPTDPTDPEDPPDPARTRARKIRRRVAQLDQMAAQLASDLEDVDPTWWG